MIDKELNGAIDAVISHLERIGRRNITALLSEFKEDILGLSVSHPAGLGLKKILQFQPYDWDVLKDQPSYRLTLLNVINNLQLALGEEESKLKILRGALMTEMKDIIHQTVTLAGHQLRVLKSALDKIASLVAAENYELPVILLELPIGNSIPCRLLELRLDGLKIKYQTVRISVLRNDSKANGMTREQLITDELAKFEKPLVIYIDEWTSGVNFNRINKILLKSTNLTIIPVGLLAHDSHSEKNYPALINDHYSFAKKCGINPQLLRYVFPVLDTPETENNFIWGEFDKLAGYSKTEFAGDFFYSICETISAICESPELLENLLEKLEQRDRNEARLEIMEECRHFNAGFGKQWEIAVAASVSINSLSDREAVAREVNLIAAQLPGYEECQFAIAAATNYLMTNSITLKKAYYFKGLVPLCTPLAGDEKMMHDLFIAAADVVID